MSPFLYHYNMCIYQCVPLLTQHLILIFFALFKAHTSSIAFIVLLYPFPRAFLADLIILFLDVSIFINYVLYPCIFTVSNLSMPVFLWTPISSWFLHQSVLPVLSRGDLRLSAHAWQTAWLILRRRSPFA